MRLRWLAEDEAADELAERKAGLEIQMLEIHANLDSLRDGEGWRNLLLQEQQNAFTDMMNAEGDQIMLARERAKLIGRLLKRESDWEADLKRLREERNALEE